jgi:hypothetical protein
MMWMIFATEAEAQAYADAATAALPRLPENVTQVWAVPRQIADGRWVVPSMNEEGEFARHNWWLDIEGAGQSTGTFQE